MVYRVLWCAGHGGEELNSKIQMMLSADDIKIGVVGLGYVGLPLSVEFSRIYNVIGFDIDEVRIDQLKRGQDVTFEVNLQNLPRKDALIFTSDEVLLSEPNFYIVTVPTPIDQSKSPDLKPIKDATETIAKYLKVNDIVVFESTVYPGLTEEVCVPILERISGLSFNKDFFVGYSPERINPGLTEKRSLTEIIKVISGSDDTSADIIEMVYKKIISAGIYRTSNIKIAEAAKVIENIQRDINIALINEIAILFEKLELDTAEVLAAARTKWNFLDFKPGLVGGHCIGVDPYYLIHKCREIGYNSEMILAGRKTNDAMPRHIVSRFVKGIIKRHGVSTASKILVLGLTFKENCPDIRNSMSFVLVDELAELGLDVVVHDPYLDLEITKNIERVKFMHELIEDDYSGILLAVGHDYYREMGAVRIKELSVRDPFFFDVKSVFPKEESDARL